MEGKASPLYSCARCWSIGVLFVVARAGRRTASPGENGDASALEIFFGRARCLGRSVVSKRPIYEAGARGERRLRAAFSKSCGGRFWQCGLFEKARGENYCERVRRKFFDKHGRPEKYHRRRFAQSAVAKHLQRQPSGTLVR